MIIATTFLGRLALTGCALYGLMLIAIIIAAMAADTGDLDTEEKALKVTYRLAIIGGAILIVCGFAAIWGAR